MSALRAGYDDVRVFADLGATVWTAMLPEGVAEELPDLYNSLYSTLDWFVTQDGLIPTGACLLDDPHHVLLFHVVDDTIEVLNKVFAISPADAERACRALFRAYPQAHRIHLEVMFSPAELHLPKRVLYSTDHLVIDLPASVEEYRASLGKRTRTNVRTSENRLRRDFPSVATELTATGDRSRELFDLFVGWKISHFAARQRTTIWEEKPDRIDKFVELLARCGEAYITTIDAKPVAIAFVSLVGDALFKHQSSYDPSYQPYRLGQVADYWVVCDAVARGARRLDVGWGFEEHKRHLGAMPHRATRLSIFSSQLARAHSAREAVEVEVRNLRRVKNVYWRWRRRAVSAVRRLRDRGRSTQ
jgi:CelD/BcsL family acetyltransferase involved in cellulose biosynthesis